MRFMAWYPMREHETRITRQFAWLPIRIGRETRWLERVTILWRVEMVPTFLPPCTPRLKWIRYKFSD